MTDSSEEDSLFPDISWHLKQQVPEIKNLTSLFLCSICHENFKNPVLVGSCSHNFCSMCIRKYLLYKQQCPSCLAPVHDADLKPNKSLNEVAEKIARMIPSMEALAKLVPSTNLPLKSPKLKKSSKPAHPQKVTPEFPSTAASSAAPEAGPSNTQIVDSSDSSQNQKKISCPVCRVDIPGKNVNQHLDQCLAEKNGEISIVSTVRRMEPLKLPVFHLLKDNEIKKRLRDLGLDATGDKKVLIQRFKNFAVIWNSQCDVDEPMSKLEMIMKLKKQENRLKSVPTTSNPLTYDSKSDPEVISTQQKAYVEKHKGQFSQLIKRAKASSKGKEKSSSSAMLQKSDSNILTEGTSSLYLTPPKQSLEATKSSPTIPLHSESSNLTNDISNLELTPLKTDMEGCKINQNSKVDEDEIEVIIQPPKPAPPIVDLLDGESDEREKANQETAKTKITPKRKHSPDSKTPLRNTSKKSHLNIPKAKSSCPICQNMVPNSLINAHVNRCLEKPQPRKVSMKSEDEDSENDPGVTEGSWNEQSDVDLGLLNATPDIITDNEDDEIICSTPKRDKENTPVAKRTLRSRQEREQSPSI